MFELYREIFMSEEKDYEAIGRYHTAKERLEQLLNMRVSAMRSLKEKLSRIDNGNIHTGMIQKFDCEASTKLMNEIVTLTGEIEIAMNEVNKYVSSVGGRLIDLR